MGKMLRMANSAEFSKANKERISLSISQLPQLYLFVETKQSINSQLFSCLFIEYNFSVTAICCLLGFHHTLLYM